MNKAQNELFIFSSTYLLLEQLNSIKKKKQPTPNHNSTLKYGVNIVPKSVKSKVQNI